MSSFSPSSDSSPTSSSSSSSSPASSSLLSPASLYNTGVQAMVPLPARATAGPFPGELHIGVHTTDARRITYYLEVKHEEGHIVYDRAPEGPCTWMLYVQPARDRYEQNLEAFKDSSGQIFFRSLRQLCKGEELFIWYGEEFGREFGIPALTPENIKGNQHYMCTKCQKTYEFPNTLKAHMRFRCAPSRAEIVASFREPTSPVTAATFSRQRLLTSPERSKTIRHLFPVQSPSCVSSAETSDASTRGEPRFREIGRRSATVHETKIGIASIMMTKSESTKVSPSFSDVRQSPHRNSNNNSTSNLVMSSTASSPLSSQPIQIFNHIHPPAVSFPMEPTSWKFYYPFCAPNYANNSRLCCPTHVHQPYGRSDVVTSERACPVLVPDSLTPSLHQFSSGHRNNGANCGLNIDHTARNMSLTSHDLCATQAAIHFPLPSDKAGEPLDLLPRHLYVTKSKKGHLCIYCGKMYSRKYGLKIHLRTHTGYKPLKCKVCLRPFGDPSNLNKHIRLHAEGETPYRCEFCGKVLVRRRDLVRHIKSRHPNEILRAEEIEKNEIKVKLLFKQECDDVDDDKDTLSDGEIVVT